MFHRWLRAPHLRLHSRDVQLQAQVATGSAPRELQGRESDETVEIDEGREIDESEHDEGHAEGRESDEPMKSMKSEQNR